MKPAMTPERRIFLRDAKRRWRRSHRSKVNEAARRRRWVVRMRRVLAQLGLDERALGPWLAELGKESPSSWRSRTRDLHDAWMLVCEEQLRSCLACRNVLVDPVPVWLSSGALGGAVCDECGKVYGKKGDANAHRI